MTTYFTLVKIEIGSYAGIKRPELTKDGSFYCIYSPESLMLQPRDNILLDLKIKINAPERLEAWINFFKRTWIQNRRTQLGSKQIKRQHHSIEYFKQELYKQLI